MSTEGFYIYCVVLTPEDEATFIPVESAGILNIQYREITALVSLCTDIAFDYSDRESLGNIIIHHQKTIEDLIKAGFRQLIPFRFGTVSSTREEVQRILSAGYEIITATLLKIKDLTEIDLAVTWSDFSSILKDLSPDQFMAEKDDASNDPVRIHDEQMKKWLSLRSRLQEKSSAAELKIVDYLSQVSSDIKHHEVMNYQMITNSAFLLKYSLVSEFEKLVGNLNREYCGALNFTIMGPLACYSFYTLEIKKVTPDKISRANIELGLRQEYSETAIREAYLKKRKMFNGNVRLHEGEEDYFNSVTNSYHTLLDYSATIRQGLFSENEEKPGSEVPEEIIMVKIRS